MKDDFELFVIPNSYQLDLESQSEDNFEYYINLAYQNCYIEDMAPEICEIIIEFHDLVKKYERPILYFHGEKLYALDLIGTGSMRVMLNLCRIQYSEYFDYEDGKEYNDCQNILWKEWTE